MVVVFLFGFQLIRDECPDCTSNAVELGCGDHLHAHVTMVPAAKQHEPVKYRSIAQSLGVIVKEFSLVQSRQVGHE